MLDLVLRLLPGLSDAALTALDAAIELERARRDVCGHGVRCGEYCADCREEYRRAREAAAEPAIVDWREGYP